MKESISQFEARSYFVGTSYPNPYVLVWKSKQHKEKLDTNLKPEKWDLQTYNNYLEWLEQ